MKNKLPFLTVLLSVLAFAQTKPLIIAESIKLPKDTLVAKQLVKDLNGFLSQKENTNKENTYVLNEELLETSILIDEFKGIEKSEKNKDDNFYKGYLTNISQLDKENFLIQFSYIGIKDNTPLLRASFEVIAKQKDGKFYFMSPLKRNTALWKSKTIGDYVFHYKNTLNEATIAEYAKSVAFVDNKFGVTDSKIEWYGCADYPESLELIGVKYKSDYNGRYWGTFTSIENKTLLMIDANDASFKSFDPHDLIHDRVALIIPQEKTNRNMVCGYAYTYGGSWGISWEDICKRFKEQLLVNKKNDWLKLYEERYNFGENMAKHLLVNQFLSGLIAKKTEKEKGISAVKALFASGDIKKDRANFFKILESETGINEANFNKKIDALIKENKF